MAATAMADAFADGRAERQALLRLMAWLSPAFPVGGFSYSGGLEGAVVEGHLADGDGLEAWIAVLMDHGGLRNDAILLSEAHRLEGEGASLLDIVALAAALAGSAERYAETTRLGEAFVLAAAAWPHPVLASLSGPVPYSVAVGAISSAHVINRVDALAAFLHAQVSHYVSVAIRLGVLGQTRGLAIVAAAEGPLLRAALDVSRLGLEDLGSATVIADTLSMRHEIQYSRLFQS
jgi:urease accessory protein